MKLIIFLFLINLNVFAQTAGFSNDLVHFGKPATSSDSVIELGDTGKFRYNFLTGKMQVTHNGSTYLDTGGDHTLDSGGTLKNKILDNSNVINSSLFGSVVTELTSDVTQGLLDRASIIDFHTSGGTDYNARIIRNQGVNGSLQFQNTGTGATSFYTDNTDQVMFYNTKGVLNIDVQNAVSEGGELRLIGSAAYNDVNIDNIAGITRFHGQNYVQFSNTRLAEVATPVASTDAANKAYVDSVAGPVQIATTPLNYSIPGNSLVTSASISVVTDGSPVEIGFTGRVDGLGASSIIQMVRQTGSFDRVTLSSAVRRTAPSAKTFGSMRVTYEFDLGGGQQVFHVNCNALGKSLDLNPPAGTVTYYVELSTGFTNGSTIDDCVMYVRVL